MKQIINIIRIEHPYDGQGYFNSCDENGRDLEYRHSQREQISIRHSSGMFPNFNDDYELNSQIDRDDLYTYKFAFKSIDQLQVAFTPDELRECINELGFRILMLEVDDYFSSQYQVIFKNPLSRKDISDLFA